MIKKALCFSVIALMLSGCGTTSPEELDRLMKEDPQFKQMILARDRARAQMHLIKQEMLGRKKSMDAQIDKLRLGYDNYAKAQNLIIEKFQATIESNRDFLRRQIDTAESELAAKTRELEGYEKTLSDVRKMLQEGRGISLSEQEKQKWEERILMLSEKIRPLQEAIQELKLQNKLKKQKIGFLTA